VAGARQTAIRVRGAAGALPDAALGRVPHPRRLVPSLASVAAGLVLVALGAAAYGVARSTSVFAVQRIEVRGASPALGAEVRRSLRPVVGSSLVGLDGSEVLRRVREVPWVAAARYDRAFPHTMVVAVVPERPVAVLRRGAESWLVSARGRVLAPSARRAHPSLPRIWARRAAPLRVGDTVADEAVARGVAALARTGPRDVPGRLRTVVGTRGQLAYLLAGGLELRLAGLASLRLKLAVAREIVPKLRAPTAGGPAYLDLTVADRPVVGGSLKSKVEPEVNSAWESGSTH
jgi:cell division septal protein FtsQ